MSRGTAIELGLTGAYNDLFSTPAERDNAQRSYVIDLPTAEISDFPDHPFKVRMDEEMAQMVESVRERGVLSPVLVRPMRTAAIRWCRATGASLRRSWRNCPRCPALSGIWTMMLPRLSWLTRTFFPDNLRRNTQ